MRGALPHFKLPVRPERIIPADAGSTSGWWRALFHYEDHPRGCGEHLLSVPTLILVGGSSPRMRGARVCLIAHQELGGIIPADAGSTGRHWECRACPQDHPRGCGEHDEFNKVMMDFVGSSPRMRGAQLYATLDDLWKRIIPADAGSTGITATGTWTPRDHPRGCGEHPA